MPERFSRCCGIERWAFGATKCWMTLLSIATIKNRLLLEVEKGTGHATANTQRSHIHPLQPNAHPTIIHQTNSRPPAPPASPTLSRALPILT